MLRPLCTDCRKPTLFAEDGKVSYRLRVRESDGELTVLARPAERKGLVETMVRAALKNPTTPTRANYPDLNVRCRNCGLRILFFDFEDEWIEQGSRKVWVDPKPKR